MPDRFRALPRRVLVNPSILSADFARLAEECRSVLEPAAGRAADMLHLDVMDGHFVPNLTMGPALTRSLRRALPDAFLDVHLMVARPGDFLRPFADAGADLLTIHAEACTPDEARRMADETRALGCAAGLAINPATPAAAAEPLLDAFDMVLVMSVVPGFSGQAFMPEVLDKVRRLRSLSPRIRIEMDGGISPANAPACREAGADILVAASAIFSAPPETRGSIMQQIGG